MPPGAMTAGTKLTSANSFARASKHSNLTVVKALSIKVGDNNDAAVCYDMAAGAMKLAWTGRSCISFPQNMGSLRRRKSPAN